jgi:hypothetical protein
MKLLKSWLKTEEVEFLCEQEDFGVISEPIPARKFMPEWFKQLHPKVGNEDKLNNATIKRCAPFLDAMSVGWIIPLAADVEFITNEDGSGVSYKWMHGKIMVENHQQNQLNPEKGPMHPSMPKPPMKFLNYWYIKIPKDYSALFVSPLNRPDPRFQCISGLVDDGYMGNDALEYINFPFFFTQVNYTGIIKAGTPLVQMILIKRDDVLTSSRKTNVKIVDKQTSDLIGLTRRRRAAQPSYYREKLWQRK